MLMGLDSTGTEAACNCSQSVGCANAAGLPKPDAAKGEQLYLQGEMSRGVLACVTCHVFVDNNTAAHCTPLHDFEDEMLDGTVTPRQASSRLSCQIVITEDLDGGTFILPEKNY